MPPRSEPDADRIFLDPHNLKGLAHPLRVRLLGILREEGPSTATRLADRLGQSSGATSYHLRQLAVYGFVVEDDERAGGGRERWWKSAHRRTMLGRPEMRAAPIESEGFLRTVAAENYERIERFVSELPRMPEAWDMASTLSDTLLRLTAGEAEQLRRELYEVVGRYREDRPGAEAPEGAERVVLQIQLMPFLRSLDTSPPDETD